MNTVEEHLSTADLANTAQNGVAGAPTAGGEEQHDPLLPQDFVQQLRTKWDEIQAGFVDEPRGAVQRADELVAQAIQRLAQSFADERGRLEDQWGRGDNVNTEELRQALRKYRSFFHRLLSV